jgi:hypothetical protein
LLPEDGIVLPRHVGATLKKEKKSMEFSAFCWLFSTYWKNALYNNKKIITRYSVVLEQKNKAQGSNSDFLHTNTDLLSEAIDAKSTSVLTFWHRNWHLNFSTPCMQNANNTGTKKGSIMK